MQKRFLFLVLLFLLLRDGPAYPIESQFSKQFLSALKDEIREWQLLNGSAVPDSKIEEINLSDGDSVSMQRPPCINLGNEGCVNGSIVGSGGDGGFLSGGGNPGK